MSLLQDESAARTLSRATLMPTGVSRMWIYDDVSIPQMSRFPSLLSMTGVCYILCIYIYIIIYTLQSCYQKSARQIHHSLSANFLGSHSSHTIFPWFFNNSHGNQPSFLINSPFSLGFSCFFSLQLVSAVMRQRQGQAAGTAREVRQERRWQGAGHFSSHVWGGGRHSLARIIYIHMI